MDDMLSTELNISYNVLKAWLCNDTVINMYMLNVTCNTLHPHNDTAVGVFHVIPHTLRIVIMAGIIFFIGIISNISLLITSSTSKRFQKPSWKYITNLAVADVLVMISMACFIFSILASPDNWIANINGVLFPSLDILLSSASMLSVAAIASDRVYTLRSLGQHISSPFNGHPNVVIISIWGYSFVIFFLALCRTVVKWNYILHKFVFWTATTVTFFGAVMVTILCYITIIFYYVKYTIVPNHMLQSPHQQLREESIGISKVREQNIKQKQARKAVFAVMAPLPFVLGWSFFLGTQTYEYVTNTFIIDGNWNIAMVVVPWIVSALNPVFYMLMTTSIRKQVKFSCRKIFGYSTGPGKTSNCEETIQLTYA